MSKKTFIGEGSSTFHNVRKRGIVEVPSSELFHLEGNRNKEMERKEKDGCRETEVRLSSDCTDRGSSVHWRTTCLGLSRTFLHNIY